MTGASLGIIVAHLRQQLPRRRGSQWYRDHSIPEGRTVCGAECGYYDQSWSQRAAFAAFAWERDDGVRIAPCAACVAQLEVAR